MGKVKENRIRSPRLLLASTPKDVSDIAEEVLGRARGFLQDILKVKGPRTVNNTMALFDELLREVSVVADQGDSLSNLHPDAEMREAGEKAHQAAKSLETELSLNRELYEAFAALDVEREDEETRYAAFKILRDFRRAGVDKDAATRRKIKELRDEIIAIGQEFERNIREDVRSIKLDGPEELDGLPDDFTSSHPPGDDGKITITTNYPDLFPVMKYARRAEVRRRLQGEYLNRGHPVNIEVLDRLLEKRHQLAKILGYDSYAEYITEDKMIGSAGAASDFVDRVASMAANVATKDYALLLRRKRKDDPKAERLEPWERLYYSELVKAEEHGFDSKALRAYFQFEKVLEGLLSLTSTLFGVRYQQVKDAEVWHESVLAYDVWEDGEILGRFYLDLHPREGKYTHAASAQVVRGAAEVQLPQALLMCNFPDPRKTEGAALMDYEDVDTFFHEFGHLLHAIFCGRVRWAENDMNCLEWDFIEVPSQMMEEWIKDPDVLQSFAVHYKTGEPIPRDLVSKLRKANAVARGLGVRRQMALAALSLSYYNRNPKGLDTTSLAKEIHSKYDLLPWYEGTHFHCGFGHLNGYSAIYYTYMWSLALQKDMFSVFQKHDSLLDPTVALKYRKTVLDPGSSRPAAEIARGFLGREPRFTAVEAWIRESYT